MIARTFNLYNLLRTTFYDLPFGCGGWHSSRKSQWKKILLKQFSIILHIVHHSSAFKCKYSLGTYNDIIL